MDHKQSLTAMVESAAVYLNHTHKEYLDLLKSKEELTDADKREAARLQFQVASYLDLLHKSYPLCYELFAANKENLDAILGLHHTYQKSRVLRKCECELCKDVQVPEQPKAEELKDAVEPQN